MRRSSDGLGGECLLTLNVKGRKGELVKTLTPPCSYLQQEHDACGSHFVTMK